MSLNSHLTELQKKHAVLAEKVKVNQRHPGIDGLETGELKKEKLRIKEEILRVSARI